MIKRRKKTEWSRQRRTLARQVIQTIPQFSNGHGHGKVVYDLTPVSSNSSSDSPEPIETPTPAFSTHFQNSKTGIKKKSTPNKNAGIFGPGGASSSANFPTRDQQRSYADTGGSDGYSLPARSNYRRPMVEDDGESGRPWSFMTGLKLPQVKEAPTIRVSRLWTLSHILAFTFWCCVICD